MPKYAPLALALLATSLLAACGQAAPLQPRPGTSLPVAPLGRDGVRKNAAELLAPRVQDVPARSDELRARSEERQDDPFDLPPKG